MSVRVNRADSAISVSQETSSQLVRASRLFRQVVDGGNRERRTIEKRYAILNLLGQGRNGTTYLARAKQAPRASVAVKVLNIARPRTELAAQLRKYIARTTSITHTGVVQVRDARVDTTGRAYIVTGFVVGRGILDYCLRTGVDLSGRLRLFEQLTGAIEASHAQGVVHGHLVPQNVLVQTTLGRPVTMVMDFALDTLSRRRSSRPIDDVRALAALLDQLLAPDGTDEGSRWMDVRVHAMQAIGACRTAHAMRIAAAKLVSEHGATPNGSTIHSPHVPPIRQVTHGISGPV